MESDPRVKGRQDNVQQSPDDIIASPPGPTVIGTLYYIIQDEQNIINEELIEPIEAIRIIIM